MTPRPLRHVQSAPHLLARIRAHPLDSQEFHRRESPATTFRIQRLLCHPKMHPVRISLLFSGANQSHTTRKKHVPAVLGPAPPPPGPRLSATPSGVSQGVPDAVARAWAARNLLIVSLTCQLEVGAFQSCSVLCAEPPERHPQNTPWARERSKE